MIDIAGLPVHIKDLALRTNKLLRFAMTSEAPFHLQRILLKNGGHVVDLAVTGRAADAFSNVNAVVKIGKLRQIVNAFPLYGRILAETFLYRFEIRAVVPYLAVTVHARLRRRHSRRRRSLDSLVTITAINAVVADVMLVAELNRLLPLDIAACQVRRACDLRVTQKGSARSNSSQNHADSGDIVSTLIKKLRHSGIIADGFNYKNNGRLRFARLASDKKDTF